MGPPMTRTMLNWSEVIEKYQGSSIKKEVRLKKWSEMGNPTSSRGRYIIHQVDLKKTPMTYIRPEPGTIKRITVGNPIKQENNLVRTKLSTLQFEKEINNTQNTKEQTTKIINNFDDSQSQAINKKPSLEEILYDTIMQDTETIPSLYSTDELVTPSKLSERDNLLLDMLELNIRDLYY